MSPEKTVCMARFFLIIIFFFLLQQFMSPSVLLIHVHKNTETLLKTV